MKPSRKRRNEKRAEQRRLANMQYTQAVPVIHNIVTSTYTLDNSVCTAKTIPDWAYAGSSPPCPEKEEATMNRDLNAETRDYLDRRLGIVYNDLLATGERTFHMNDDEAPESAVEAVARIQAGKFVALKKGDDDFDRWSGWCGNLRWRDPATPADTTGFETFADKLRKNKAEVKDAIMVSDATAALAALQAFANTTVQ